jgi:electron-transferring-flavoprotein dehydrogenase
LAKQTLLAEGCRGSLSELLMARYQLRKGKQPQSYGIGFKEIWEIKPEHSKPGVVTHTVGWPLDTQTYGGSFVYHLDQNKLAIGFVIGLDYRNPFLSPFEEFQRFKTHPAIRHLLDGGRRISYGARALNEGGWQSIPELSFPGGALIGCSAGFMNVPRIKGSHTAMKSGMLAAEGVVEFIRSGVNDYSKRLKKSWVSDELFKVRNIRPGFHKGFWFGMVNAAFETYLSRGHSPWTLKYEPDHICIDTTQQHKPIIYPKPDGVISFDRLSSVFLCAIHHEENQPCHLKLKNPDLAIQHNYTLYASPEQRYCPAGVYEVILGDKEPRLQINSANCIHCKTCDIKDPLQNIQWVTPQGGSGPTYGEM